MKRNSSLKSFSQLLSYATPWRGEILIASIYSIINKIFDIMPEILIGFAVDLVVKRQDSFIASLGFQSVESQITILAVCTFLIGCAAWLYMIYVLWFGEGKTAVNTTSASVQTAYNTMMWIIIVGWAIYPAGYVFGYLLGTVDSSSLNLIYNLADFVNKILFGVVIWKAAIDDKQTA